MQQVQRRLTTGIQKALLLVPEAGEHGADLPWCFDRHDFGRMRLAVVEARAATDDGAAEDVVAAFDCITGLSIVIFGLCIAAAATTHSDVTIVLSFVMTS